MSKAFFNRLKDYFESVAAVIRSEASSASIYPNPTDIGFNRESAYVKFLQRHVPAKCSVFLGGFIFGMDGTESGQMDIIITTDTALKYDFPDSGKSFSCVEGTLGAVSIKSYLNEAELIDALTGISKIPAVDPKIHERVQNGIRIKDYDDWPYKVIFAYNGISAKSLLHHLEKFYVDNPIIPINRRPHIIHVAGKCVIIRATRRVDVVKDLPEGSFIHTAVSPDIHGMMWVLDELQIRASASHHIHFTYSDLLNKVLDIEN